MDDLFRAETERATAFFDEMAPRYREEFAGELDGKPFDRALLGRIGDRLRAGAPVLEVGAGPAHISAFLAGRGARMVASDASAGQLREAKIAAPWIPLVRADLARLPFAANTLGGIVAFYCLIYGPSGPLSEVFAEWRRALAPGGLVVISVHAGTGEIAEEKITVVLRDIADLTGRLRDAGFTVEECTTRPPYRDEYPTERTYIVAAA